MGRWHSIANKKAAGDAHKSHMYAKIGKLLEIAARKGGDDPNMNPALDVVLQKARYHSLPREVIDKAIKKGAGKLEGQELYEIMYEGYGPAGAAFYIKCIASNTNRTAANIRAILAKMGGAMAEPGSVSWQFAEKGVIIIDGKCVKEIKKGQEVVGKTSYDREELENDILSLDIEDYQEENNQCRILTSREAFIRVRKSLEQVGYSIIDADIQYVPQNEISLLGDDLVLFEKIITVLEEDDDVDSVYHNVA